MKFEFATAAQLLNVGRHALADAGDLEQLLRFVDQSRDLLGEPFERFGGAAIGADTEGVVAVDLHEISGFVEDVGDGLVVQATAPGRNCIVWGIESAGCNSRTACSKCKAQSAGRAGPSWTAAKDPYWPFVTLPA